MAPHLHKKQYVPSEGQKETQSGRISPNKVIDSSTPVLVPGVPNSFVMQDDKVKRMFEEKETALTKAKMVKPSQVEPSTWCVLQHPKTKKPRFGSSDQKEDFPLWNKFSNLKKGEAEKDAVYVDASKPNLRFERHSKSEDVINSEESAIKAKVKELEKAISIDEDYG